MVEAWERTFQLSGRWARADIWVIKSISSSLKNALQPVMMNSSQVPGWSATASQRASISSRSAKNDGTGSLLPSEWVVDCDDENPRPPASSASWSSRTISATCSGEAAFPVPSAPMT